VLAGLAEEDLAFQQQQIQFWKCFSLLCSRAFITPQFSQFALGPFGQRPVFAFMSLLTILLRFMMPISGPNWIGN